jgi:Ca2+-binding EF-hand superfamily protein
MPFAGEDDDMRKCIIRGKFSMSSSRWGTVSSEAKAFIRALMEPDPSERLSAQSALGHGWITKHYQAPNPRLDCGLVNAMSDYAKASTLRRCCLNAMAWHLSNDETIQIRDAFLALDVDFSGTLTQSELQDLMVGSMTPDEAAALFMAVDANHDLEVHYSEFLAAVMCRNVKISDDILQATFRKFDLDLSGLITAADLKALLGESFEGRSAEGLIEEAVGLGEFGEDGHLAQRGGIAFDDFARFVCGEQGVCPIGSVPNVSHSMLAKASMQNTATFAASQAYSKEAAIACDSCMQQKHQKVLGLLGNLDGVKSAGGGKDLVKSFSPVQRVQPRIESTDAATPGCHCILQ